MIESVLAQGPAAGLSLLSVMVLVGVFTYLYRMPSAMPGLGWWALGLAVVGLRMLILLRQDDVDPFLYVFLLDVLHSGSMIVFLCGALVAIGRKPKIVLLGAFWVATALWSAVYQQLDLNYYVRAMPLTLAVGGTAIVTGIIFFRGGRDLKNPGLVLAGWAFLLWGLHRLDYPWTLTSDWAAPWVFRLTMALSLAFNLSMIIAAFHHTQLRLRQTERLLREGAKQLEDIVAASPVPMVAIDPATGHVLFNNPPAAKRFPLTQTAGGAVTVNQMLDSATGARFLQMLQNDRTVTEFESRLQTTDGKPCWAVLNSVPLDYAGTEAALITAHDITDRKQIEVDLHHQATTDSLTTAYTRRHYLEVSEKELLRARRYDNPISVIVLDLDHFKKVNDTHGHTAGDTVLKIFARSCLSPLRTNDILGRIGGEEFAITLPEATVDAAREVAERLRQSFAETAIDIGGEALRCTLSAGVTQCRPSDASIDDVLKRADRALYEAKGAGRNRVKTA